MRPSIVRELRTDRIVARFFLTRHTCIFCNKVLLDPKGAKDGNGRKGHPIPDTFTEHHVDGNHENTAPENRVIVHRVCHKIYHARDGKKGGRK